ncbi:MAG TPA: hypothetical protein VII69_10930 [Candidatus Eremiobacteraceae bacterium]
MLRRFMMPQEREIANSIDDVFRNLDVSVPKYSIDQDDELLELGLDFILYLGFGPCDARSARIAKYGLWRFRFGDVSKYENYPPGVHEVISGDPVTTAVLCSQHFGTTSAKVLRSGVFATILHQPNANAEQMLSEVTLWPAYAAANICRGHQDDAGDFIELKSIPLPQLPKLVTQARLALSLLTNKIMRLPNLFFDDSWNVGIVDGPIHDFLQPAAPWQASWFPNGDPNLYCADPMGAIVDGKRLVLCETYDFRTQLGSISALGVDGRGWTPTIAPALSLKVHASYPYLFRAEDVLYCVPETSQARDAVLYRFASFGDGLQYEKSLLPQVPCLDPTVFKHEGLWWLFCTDATDGEHLKLRIWFARDLLGDFMPHPLNPVKIDVRSSRPAGAPFVHDGRLFRPSQDCSRTYGGAVTINEITKLSPTRFQEHAVAIVRPDPGSPYRSGVHTLSSFGDQTLIDSKRMIFTGRGIREKMSAAVARILRR